MIQIKIIHFKDGTHTVKQIKEHDKVLADFNESENRIDFSVLKDRIGEKIGIHHFNIDDEDNETFDYSNEKILREVATDADGIDFIMYS